MNGIWYYAIAFVAIWFIAIVFKNKLEKYGVEVEFPVIMWKTQRLRGLINKIANISPKFWKWFMNVGIVISVGFMLFMAYALIISLTTITETASVAILLPGVEMPGSPIFVPFFYGFLGLATVLIVHEFSHGILSRVEKVKIKSIGLLLFAILPGAFVEPDEEDMEQSKKSSRLRIYAAGSMANITLAVIALIIFYSISSFAIPATFDENGVQIETIVNDAPVEGILSEGMIIKSINNITIYDSDSYIQATSTLKPNDNATITTNEGTFSLQLGENPNNHSRGYMGVQASKNFIVKEDVANMWGNDIPWVLFELSELFKWIFFLNFAVGTFNLLPMKPLDGGHMLEDILSYKLSEKIVKPTVKYISMVFAFIIVFSIVYGFIGGII
ncbi:site-2 protease family protein [Methanobrevibacter sp. OttesenSCG-928-K11]|nr:site-2 protease family protein [Methanobrevibacter sp. OttesenSCG-928-K11]MDL2270692.1 site-2 protease family protein [Methanobrevibacter sp. OttesenSCG-928-I08]